MNVHGIYERGTALAFASEKGCYKIVEYLLERGANVNILGDYTALIWASSNGHTKIVEKLLSQPGIDVNIKGYFGYTALMLASEMGHTEIVEMLLEKGANVNAKANNGWTALMKASRFPVGQQHEEIMKLLIRNGATIPVDREDLKAFHHEMREEDKRNYDSFKKEVRKDVINKRAFNMLPPPPSPIIEEEKTGKFSVMSLNPPLNPQPQPYKSTTAAEEVFSRKDDVERKIRDYLGGKRKTRKARKPNKRFIKTRSKRQRGGNKEDDILYLISASVYGDTKLVRKLLDEGADVNAKSGSGSTALMMASSKGHKEIVAMLLEKKYGADVNVKNNEGWTALDRASLNEHTEIVEMLLKNGADVNTKDNGGYTALIEASRKGHTEIVAMLLEKGADVNATNNIGWTALIWASVNGHKETVAKLLKDGADINAKTNLGKTALMMARWEGRRTEIINMLTAAIETEQKVRGHKQEAMEQVEHRDVKIPSLRTMIHRQLPTHPTTEINEYDFILPPSKLGGKRKTKRKIQKSNQEKIYEKLAKNKLLYYFNIIL